MEKIEKKKQKKSTDAREYPAIYSYIYEREIEDIKRLSSKIKKKRQRKKDNTVKTVLGFKIIDGKATPIYSD